MTLKEGFVIFGIVFFMWTVCLVLVSRKERGKSVNRNDSGYYIYKIRIDGAEYSIMDMKVSNEKIKGRN